MAIVTRTIREKPTLSNRKIEGYASVFYDGTPGTQYAIGPNHVERVQPGAFQTSLRSGDKIIACSFHNEDMPLGVSPGNMTLREDNKGLHYTIEPMETQAYREMAVYLESGIVDASSFGFEPAEQEWIREGSLNVLLVRSVRLWHVSPVIWPAYANATAELRSKEFQKISLRHRLNTYRLRLLELGAYEIKRVTRE